MTGNPPPTSVDTSVNMDGLDDIRLIYPTLIRCSSEEEESEEAHSYLISVIAAILQDAIRSSNASQVRRRKISYLALRFLCCLFANGSPSREQQLHTRLNAFEGEALRTSPARFLSRISRSGPVANIFSKDR